MSSTKTHYEPPLPIQPSTTLYPWGPSTMFGSPHSSYLPPKFSSPHSPASLEFESHGSGYFIIIHYLYVPFLLQPCWCSPDNILWPIQLLQFLNLILLMWRIWWDPNNASKWQMGFNLLFKELIIPYSPFSCTGSYILHKNFLSKSHTSNWSITLRSAVAC